MEFLNIFINPILKLLSVMNGIAHTQRVYPASWEIRIHKPDCLLEAEPWMADQEVNFPPVTYWKRAVPSMATAMGYLCTGMDIVN